MKESAVEMNRNRHRLAARTDGVRVNAAGYLERGWVIANHKLVSFHAAFISSILSLPAVELTERAAAGENIKSVVLSFMFSPSTWSSGSRWRSCICPGTSPSPFTRWVTS